MYSLYYFDYLPIPEKILKYVPTKLLKKK